MSRRGCIFCGSVTNKMSREHLFHRAWGKRIPHSPETVRLDYTSYRNDDETLTEMPVSMFEACVGGVCKPCNQSWMNHMDLAVGPLVIELANLREQEIPADQVQAFATWAAKVALLRAEVNRGQDWHAHPKMLRDFYQSQLPPKRAIIRVGVSRELLKEGGSNGSLHPEALDPAQRGFVRTSDHRDELYRINVVSFSLGGLYVHAILPSSRAPRVKVEQFDDRTRELAGPTARKLWPPDGGRVRFTHWMTQDIADRIGEVAYLTAGVRSRPIPPRAI